MRNRGWCYCSQQLALQGSSTRTSARNRASCASTAEIPSFTILVSALVALLTNADKHELFAACAACDAVGAGRLRLVCDSRT
ncbi:uncharacterized protein EKO05_0006120 [Ascochyta rabiei]|uniref:uncharacterized protein n=1 Tax=Didymella rabiei TaxID=5454 RepID=UPI00220DCCAF|nr:uncharacterized protein EKO05_0006120 [Ascochyta rabiei]UPX15679.1 hypothetical protein EKO05_0006120 [Ascochyta rabiei]